MKRKLQKNYGLNLKPIESSAYLGGVFSQIPEEILQPGGQWDEYLISGESQNKYLETMGCVSWGTLNAIEILIKKLYNE